MKKLLLVVLSIWLAMPVTKADEGMWLPMFIKRLNHVDMQKAGLKLTAEEIYSVNNSSLKDAIIHFGGGCTGEIVSPEGLIFTNHHCGYGQIQSHSTVENDYLTKGFWAKSHAEELSNPGLSVSFLVRMEDVTEKVLAEIGETKNEAERQGAVQKAMGKLSKENNEEGRYRVVVRGFYHDQEFYMFVYEDFKDVRLVGAPPSSIGKFGGDTDNWMWPRHTGDFSIFRVYTDKDGKPADYSKDNVPMKSKHYLPVSIAGVNKGDYAMIMGYPGRTQRYLSASAVQMALDLSNPTVVNVREKKLALMKEDMDANDDIRIKYSSKYYQSSNYYKYFIGQSKQLTRMRVVDQKKNQEKQFNDWASANEDRKNKYGNVISTLDKNYDEYRKYILSRQYLVEAIFLGAEVFGEAYGYEGLYKTLSDKEAKPEDKQKAADALKGGVDAFFKDYNMSTDKKLFAGLLEMYYKGVPMNQHSPYLNAQVAKYKNDFNRMAEEYFKRTMFADKNKLNAFLSNPSASKLGNDPVYKLVTSIFDFYGENHRNVMRKLDQSNNEQYRAFIQGMREMNPEKSFYPDANSTMRLSYGSVQDYYPMDAVYYNYFTTLEGVMEKKDNSNEEFYVEPRLEELYNKKDYGRYGKDGQLVVNFTTTNDITGGNSGSPVINGKGELIGLAFDGNWEAMSGDIAFDSTYKRTICVDARYVLWVIDKYAGASNIINELKIVQ
ncbi:MAG TPA: S46 family peptidase [Bacteroidia bacterium]|nr:S46 family peptidase [Bacteroidia bacterium]